MRATLGNMEPPTPAHIFTQDPARIRGALLANFRWVGALAALDACV